MFRIEKLNATETEEGGTFVEKWTESYGDIDILVEIKKGDWGGLRNRVTERAFVRKRGGKRNLFKAERTLIRGRLVMVGCSVRGVLGDSARNMAFVWAMGHSLSAQAAFLEAERANRQAGEKWFAEEVCLAAEQGVIPYLAQKGVGDMSTIELADIVGISSNRLGAWLGTQGFAKYYRGKWEATNSALQSGVRGKHVVWNAAGLNEIRACLYEKKVFFLAEDALIRLLRKRTPDSPVWKVIEKVWQGVVA